MPAVGTYNQTLVLDVIRRSESGLSRTELAELTGLSPQTLSNVARRLVAEGLVIEGERIIAGPGKPRTLLRLNPDARFAVGLHLDPSVNTFVVVDLSGQVVAHTQRRPLDGASQERLLAELVSGTRSLLDSADLPPERVLGIGAAAPGPIDDDTGTLLTPPLMPGWHHIPLRARLAELTGLPVTIEKDVTAAMVGERWVDAGHDLTDAILVYYGTGVGVGLTVDGTVLRGRTGNAGDVGHLLVEEGGPLCHCGASGCFGVSVAPERVIADALGIPATELVAWVYAPEAMQRIRDAALGGDARALAVMDRTAVAFARAIVLLNNVLDVGVAMIGGPVWDILSDVLRPAIEHALPRVPQSTTTRPLRMVASRLGVDLAAAGAACLVLDGAFRARIPASSFSG